MQPHQVYQRLHLKIMYLFKGPVQWIQGIPWNFVIKSNIHYIFLIFVFVCTTSH